MLKRDALLATRAPARFVVCKLHTLQSEGKGAFSSFRDDDDAPDGFGYGPSPLAPHLSAKNAYRYRCLEKYLADKAKKPDRLVSWPRRRDHPRHHHRKRSGGAQLRWRQRQRQRRRGWRRRRRGWKQRGRRRWRHGGKRRVARPWLTTIIGEAHYLRNQERRHRLQVRSAPLSRLRFPALGTFSFLGTQMTWTWDGAREGAWEGGGLNGGVVGSCGGFSISCRGVPIPNFMALGESGKLWRLFNFVLRRPDLVPIPNFMSLGTTRVTNEQTRSSIESLDAGGVTCRI